MSWGINYIPVSDNTQYYKILDLKPQESNQQLIKKMFSKFLKEYHPDKNIGNEDKMQLIVRANEILTNQGFKFLYDKFGVIVFEIINPDHHYVFLTYYKWAYDLVNLNEENLRALRAEIIELKKTIIKLEKELQDKSIENKEKFEIEKEKIKSDNLSHLEANKVDLFDLQSLERTIEESKNSLINKEALEKLLCEKDFVYKKILSEIKIYIEDKIKRKFKEVYLDSLDPLQTLEITDEITSNYFDYLYAFLRNPRLFTVSAYDNLKKDSLFCEEALNISGTIDFKRSNVLSVSLDTEFKLDKVSKLYTQSFNFNVNKIFKLPSSVKIFENDFISMKNSFEYNIYGSEINIKNGIIVPNFLFNENISFKYDTDNSINFHKKFFSFNSNKLTLAFKILSTLNANISVDLNSKNFETHIIKKIDKSNKITLYANIGKTKSLIGIQKIFQSSKPFPSNHASNLNNISASGEYAGKYSCQNSLYLHENGIILSNQNSINFKIFGFDFDTSINLYKKEKIKFSTSFALGLRINKLNFKIPIKISKTKNFVIFGLAFLSNFFGPIMNYFYMKFKKYLRRTGKYYVAISEIIKEKYENFYTNPSNIDSYNKILLREKENNGLIINYAFIGSLEDMEQLNYDIKLLGISNPLSIELKIFKEKIIYDIKMALSMKIVQSKMIIKNDLFDSEGIYNPVLEKYENIAIIICYSYKSDTYYDFIKNVNNFRIPLVD